MRPRCIGSANHYKLSARRSLKTGLLCYCVYTRSCSTDARESTQHELDEKCVQAFYGGPKVRLKRAAPIMENVTKLMHLIWSFNGILIFFG